MIGIDGRPCSGKTILALALATQLNAQLVHFDNFFLPKNLWPKSIKPSFLFPYFRNEEFKSCLKSLNQGLEFTYRAFDFESGSLEKEAKSIKPGFPLIIEGCSVLSKDLLSFMSTKIFVMSELSSEFSAISSRENKKSLDVWKNLYLPSVDLYFSTKPWESADYIYKGRGLGKNF
jgi:uridine kinase